MPGDVASVDQARPSRVTPVPLSVVAAAVGAATPPASPVETVDVGVTGMTLDSRAVRPGDLYAAVPGANVHGAAFARQAIEAGAVAVLTDPPGAAAAAEGTGAPLVVVPDPRHVLGVAAAVVYGHPAKSFRLVGITGTHGKTTTTHLAEAGVRACDQVPARVGTVGASVAGEPVATRLTTPEAPELHGLFAVMRERGAQVCAMEVSSHSLVLGRVDGVVFDLAVFTNLGRDHLDFHDSVESYFAAKATLFTPERARRALVNVDDEHGRRLAATCPIPVHTFSAHGGDAHWRATGVVLGATGSSFRILGPEGVAVPARVQLPGSFNVANALAAVAALVEVGVPAQCAASGVAALAAVPGRMERVDAGQEFAVVVDYAHKPDAVGAALAGLRSSTPGRLIVVLGAGGDRDPGKRALMGEVAAQLSDVLVVTDDNPRSEPPASIRAAVLAGARGVPATDRAELVEVADRREAIRWALTRASGGDCVVVAGKGHEQGQESADGVLPFDDRTVAGELLAELGYGGRR